VLSHEGGATAQANVTFRRMFASGSDNVTEASMAETKGAKVLSVWLVVPESVDDPGDPSGGNRYDLEVEQALSGYGWQVQMCPVAGSWPQPADEHQRALAEALAAVPDGATVLVDGLIGCAAPQIIESAGRRLRVVVLVHMPIADEIGIDPAVARKLEAAEAWTLQCAATVVATSLHTASQLLGRYGLAREKVHVAEPGVHLPEQPLNKAAGGDRLVLDVGSVTELDDTGATLVTAQAMLARSTGGRWLCVGAVTPVKGHDRLVSALAPLADDPRWELRIAGPTHRDPGHVAHLLGLIDEAGLTDRITLTGPLHGSDLEAAYRWADLVLHPSLREAFGMAITEALSYGTPVFTHYTGGMPDALGTIPDRIPPTGGRLRRHPGRLLHPDTNAWTTALREWLDDTDLQDQLRDAARQRRHTLNTWNHTALKIISALRGDPAHVFPPRRPTIPEPWA
jgi:glycosyltransferase involved in cell wall biosynthesis